MSLFAHFDVYIQVSIFEHIGCNAWPKRNMIGLIHPFKRELTKLKINMLHPHNIPDLTPQKVLDVGVNWRLLKSTHLR